MAIFLFTSHSLYHFVKLRYVTQFLSLNSHCIVSYWDRCQSNPRR